MKTNSAPIRRKITRENIAIAAPARLRMDTPENVQNLFCFLWRILISFWNKVCMLVTYPNTMKKQTVPSSASDNKLIVRGVHLDITEALRAFIESKCERLFRHQARIIRIRVDLEYDKIRKGKPRFFAKGHIEIGGPDMIVTMESDDAYKAIDMMSQKLDRLLRVRASAMKKKKLRPHAVELDAELPKASAVA